MSEFHCLDIEFPDVDFSSYYIKGKTEIEKIHHAHLYAKKDEIELKIFYDDQTYFGEKLTSWASNIDWKKFGSFLKVELTKNHTNERLQGFIYIYFYVFVFISVVTGVCIEKGFFPDWKADIETVHKLGIYWFPIFVLLHLTGIIIAELSTKKGITSKMIGGD